MKNRISIFQGAKPLFLAAFLSGVLAGCGTTPPPLPSGERVPINHYEGQWTPADDLTAKHETPQEKAKRIKKERLELIRRQKEQAAKEAARKQQEERSEPLNAFKSSPKAEAKPQVSSQSRTKQKVAVTHPENKPQVLTVKDSPIKETVTPISKEEAKAGTVLNSTKAETLAKADSAGKLSQEAEQSSVNKNKTTKFVSQKKKISTAKKAESKSKPEDNTGAKKTENKDRSFSLWPVYPQQRPSLLLKNAPIRYKSQVVR